MNQSLIYLPCFFLILWTGLVMIVMFIRRVDAIKQKNIKLSYFRIYRGTEEQLPEKMVQASRNFTNLFEVPTFFYALSLFAFVLNGVDLFILISAWAFVVLRVVHSIIHLTSNNVIWRMQAYTLSWIALLFMGFKILLFVLG